LAIGLSLVGVAVVGVLVGIVVLIRKRRIHAALDSANEDGSVSARSGNSTSDTCSSVGSDTHLNAGRKQRVELYA
jgi:hypothetical protein